MPNTTSIKYNTHDTFPPVRRSSVLSTSPATAQVSDKKDSVFFTFSSESTRCTTLDEAALIRQRSTVLSGQAGRGARESAVSTHSLTISISQNVCSCSCSPPRPFYSFLPDNVPPCASGKNKRKTNRPILLQQPICTSYGTTLATIKNQTTGLYTEKETGSFRFGQHGK